MDVLESVDELYVAFCSTLPRSLRGAAAGLSCTLRLAPTPDVPWSQVFSNQVTLAAPALFAEAMPGIGTTTLHDAVLAHALSVIEAFGSDRIRDGQVATSRELEAVLDHARIARDEALRRVAPGVRDAAVDGLLADAVTRSAIDAEREVFASNEGATLSEYEGFSVGKQRAGFPATMALTFAAGWNAERRAMVSRTLEAIWIGLQLHDDVLDWEDDVKRGGAWAVVLARAVERDTPRLDRRAAPRALRDLVHSTSVLALMLERSRRLFRAVRLRAKGLKLRRLAAWAAEREAEVANLAAHESRNAGYTNRAHALSAWAREVLG